MDEELRKEICRLFHSGCHVAGICELYPDVLCDDIAKAISWGNVSGYLKELNERGDKYAERY